MAKGRNDSPENVVSRFTGEGILAERVPVAVLADSVLEDQTDLDFVTSRERLLSSGMTPDEIASSTISAFERQFGFRPKFEANVAVEAGEDPGEFTFKDRYHRIGDASGTTYYYVTPEQFQAVSGTAFDPASGSRTAEAAAIAAAFRVENDENLAAHRQRIVTPDMLAGKIAIPVGTFVKDGDIVIPKDLAVDNIESNLRSAEVPYIPVKAGVDGMTTILVDKSFAENPVVADLSGRFANDKAVELDRQIRGLPSAEAVKIYAAAMNVTLTEKQKAEEPAGKTNLATVALGGLKGVKGASARANKIRDTLKGISSDQPGVEDRPYRIAACQGARMTATKQISQVTTGVTKYLSETVFPDETAARRSIHVIKNTLGLTKEDIKDILVHTEGQKTGRMVGLYLKQGASDLDLKTESLPAEVAKASQIKMGRGRNSYMMQLNVGQLREDVDTLQTVAKSMVDSTVDRETIKDRVGEILKQNAQDVAAYSASVKSKRSGGNANAGQGADIFDTGTDQTQGTAAAL